RSCLRPLLPVFRGSGPTAATSSIARRTARNITIMSARVFRGAARAGVGRGSRTFAPILVERDDVRECDVRERPDDPRGPGTAQDGARTRRGHAEDGP